MALSPLQRRRFLLRTRDGRIVTFAFVALFLLAMPPVTHAFLNRIEPSFFGVPFLYVALFIVYVALIAVLILAYRRGV